MAAIAGGDKPIGSQINNSAPRLSKIRLTINLPIAPAFYPPQKSTLS
jgi:hypothetical protein